MEDGWTDGWMDGWMGREGWAVFRPWLWVAVDGGGHLVSVGDTHTSCGFPVRMGVHAALEDAVI